MPCTTPPARPATAPALPCTPLAINRAAPAPAPIPLLLPLLLPLPLSCCSQVDGVLDVHDLHVWNLSVGLPILTAHVHIANEADANLVLTALEAYVRGLGIRHSTIQICNPQGKAIAVAST